LSLEPLTIYLERNKMSNVFTFDPRAVENEKRKLELLEVLDFMKSQVEEGIIKEFVACSADDTGSCQIHVAAFDLPGSIGMFEIGKHLLISTEAGSDD
jgi:hypothetical protein